MGKDYICGPPLKQPVPDCSFAEYFIPLLRSHPEDVVQLDATTGYAETSLDLLKKSIKVCESLRKFGFGQDDVFSLLARNSSDSISAMFGVFWLGGVIAPVDPIWKTIELRHSLGKVIKPTVIFCEENLVSTVTSTLKNLGKKCRIIAFGNKKNIQKPIIAFEDLLNMEVDVESYVPCPVESPWTKVALILPTSGSTGLSKGVGITHRNLIFQALSSEGNELTYKSFLVLSHFFWISFFIQLMNSLQKRTTRIYMTEVNVKNILIAVEKYKPEMIMMSTPFLTALLKNPEVRQCDFSPVKCINLAGCLMSPTVLDAAKILWNGEMRFINFYGASEVSGGISIAGMGENMLSVGKICKGVRVKVVDLETGAAVGPNRKGEILVASPGVMNKYVNNEDATREVFDGGWFRTGDLGYYDRSETLYVIERLKEIIKSTEGQIAPSEVEHAIECIEGVKDVGIVGMYSDTDHFYLIGLVVKRSNSQIAEADIRNFLKENLADFKIPKLIKFVSQIPRNTAGKMRRKELREMAISLCEKEL